ncbi:MAG: hypothetical protein IKS76_04985, partial [Paludibacteraceae bacterium]|nr:hypothetical protein [Paludibacteraceae bacterium]
SLDFNREGEIEIPVAPKPVDGDPKSFTTPHVVFDPNYNPFARTSKPVVKGWEQMYQQPVEESVQLFDIPLSDIVPYQYKSKYLLLPSTSGLMIVNQHRAHACVLYNQYIAQMNMGKGVSQQLLFPEVIDLTPDEMVLMGTIIDDMRFVGFELEQFSKNAYSISGIPATLNAQDIQSALHNMLHLIRETGANAKDEWRKKIALSLAEDTAIPYGKKLSTEEAQHLLEQLFDLPSYLHTPDGKKIVVILSDDDFQKRFN